MFNYFQLDSPFLIDGVNVKPIRYDPVDTKVTTSSVAGWGAIEVKLSSV